MKATNFIRKDHETLKALFTNFHQAVSRQQNGKKSLCQAICKELEIHSDLEKNLFYPELRNTSSPDLSRHVDAAEKDHEAMEELMDKLHVPNLSEKDAEHLLTELVRLASEHFEVEENEILEEARAALSEQRLEELGLELEQRRRLLTQVAA